MAFYVGLPNGPVVLCDNAGSTCDSQLSSVEFPITFSQFLLNLDYESICDPPGGDTLLAQGIYLTDSLN